MKSHTAIAAALLLGFGSTAVLAESPAGIPADPNTNENVQPAPGASNPSDPAAGSNPAARVPTSPPGTDPGFAAEGAGTGETGFDSPAGIPADPTTDQNVQPAPSIDNPADPAAGSNPAARVPTAPEERQ
jgi:hypothetical protein